MLIKSDIYLFVKKWKNYSFSWLSLFPFFSLPENFQKAIFYISTSINDKSLMWIRFDNLETYYFSIFHKTLNGSNSSYKKVLNKFEVIG